ncbi:unnamed protein product [Symbiodinium sp. CCMP2456]|nr:unnamed protein product [Symbiodinium sp. CCMP2456]
MWTFPQYIYWANIWTPVERVNWASSPEERRRVAHDSVLKLAQNVHVKAEWQRRTALGFFEAVGELLCCTTSSSVDTDELRL